MFKVRNFQFLKFISDRLLSMINFTAIVDRSLLFTDCFYKSLSLMGSFYKLNSNITKFASI